MFAVVEFVADGLLCGVSLVALLGRRGPAGRATLLCVIPDPLAVLLLCLGEV